MFRHLNNDLLLFYTNQGHPFMVTGTFSDMENML